MGTKVDAQLEAAEEAHQNDPERAELIARTRRFKASWIELAEALTHVRGKATWRRFGFESFEDYTGKELKLRPETVDKLTGSFAFLQKRAPQVLTRDGIEESIPTYQAVDFLRRAEERDEAPAEVVTALRKKVLDDVVPLPTVAREFKATVFPTTPDEQKKKDTAALKNVAGRLREILQDTRVVSKRLAGDVTASLDELLATLSAEASRAA
ncbi:hypothetical protein BH09MYX1_BH09MYX1_12770 [soil metagenome]